MELSGFLYNQAKRRILKMQLKEYTGKEINDLLDSGSMSILEALGASDLKKEMVHVGKLCSFYVRMCCLSKNEKNLRKRSSFIIRTAAPSKLEGSLPESDDTIVVGFNHPSLGEVCRLLPIGFDCYPDREFLFPVNLPWYEAMVNVIPQLKRLGIRMTPMLTPATEEKLNRMFEGDESKLSDIQFLKMVFDRRYIKELKSISGNKGIIFIAPSATRQSEIIGDYVHPSMTVVAHIVLKGGRKAVFAPVAVIPPKYSDRELNLFRSYRFVPCESFSSEEVASLTTGRDREFDFSFLKRIEKKYMDSV